MRLAMTGLAGLLALGWRARAAPAGAERAGGAEGEVSLFLAGDVMTGRGVDQVLPHPGDPTLYEPGVQDANDYVALAEMAHGPIPRPVDFAYVWGDALGELERRRPDARIVNLETAVTRALDPMPKGINYKMHPANAPVLAAAGIDCCVLANNHVLDWKADGLIETLETLEAAGILTAGAGRDRAQAETPATLETGGGARVLVFALASGTSGVPGKWAAGPGSPGVDYLPDLSMATAQRLAARLRAARRPGDVVVVSLHWGPNWGYEVGADQTAFAHALVDEAGADVVFGHSSHHAKGIEVYRGRLILYGCGDFIDDYEGISGYEAYRDDLAVMYLPRLRRETGELTALVMVPFRIHKFRLEHAGPDDAAWLRDTLDREGQRFGTRVRLGPENELILGWD